MSSLGPAASAIDGGPPSDLVEVGVYPTSAEGFAHGLVVLAMGRSYWLIPSPVGHRLLVEPEASERAREQLSRFDRESVGWPPRPLAESTIHAGDMITPLLWALVILGVFRIQGERPTWTDAGVLDAQAVFKHGEWWRAGTALFLHSDTGHAVSNVLSGILVFSAVLKTLGSITGWLLLAAASLAGNLAIAAIHHREPYRSLGASTAIFAGVGLLTGRALRVLAHGERPHRWRAMFVALASGLIVLGLYGAGGVQVDVGAHATGFIAGLTLGFGVPAGSSTHPQ